MNRSLQPNQPEQPPKDTDRAMLEKYVVKTAEQMGESAICLSLFTENYKKGTDSLLQFALAVMMDKPLFLLVPVGVNIPERVQRVADGIERYVHGDKASFSGATERLMHKAREKGFSQ